MSSVLKVDQIQSDTGTVNVASKIEFPVGSAAAPSIFPTGDTNTGIFFPAADTIAFAEGGAEAMRIDSSGLIAMGTTDTSNTTRLRLQGGSTNVRATSAQLMIQRDTVSTQYEGINFNAGPARAAFIGRPPNSDDIIFGFDAGSVLIEVARIIGSSGILLVGTASVLTYTGRLQVYDTGGRAVSFQTTVNDQALLTRCSNASFNNTVQFVTADRSANSAYSFIQAYSSGTGDGEFNLRGDGNGYADGTWNNNGADYAEFFESANGQALTLGATVVLNGNKVREATDQDPASAIIGVVRPKEPSKASMVVGNTAWNKWANKYLTDDFDRYIMEDHDVVEWTDEDGKEHSYESQAIPAGITVPDNATRKTHDENGNKFQHYKLNPEWDPDSEYVNRENRPEWNIIGLLGQVKILKGQPVGDRWIKMRDVSETVEEWFIR